MKRIIVSIILVHLSNHAVSQYDTYNEMQQGYQYPYQNLQYQQYQPEYRNQRWKDNQDYNEYEENICECDKCDELKPGCLNSCPNCLTQPIVPSNYIFLPFPYPYPMTDKETTTESTTTQTTTTTTTTTTEATTLTTSTEAKTTISEATQKSTFQEETDMTMSPFHVKQKSPYMITSLRKTKPHWLPKYGLLPISDTFAEKLMLQIRNMKVLHSRKDYSRDVDEMGPYK